MRQNFQQGEEETLEVKDQRGMEEEDDGFPDHAISVKKALS